MMKLMPLDENRRIELQNLNFVLNQQLGLTEEIFSLIMDLARFDSNISSGY